jgi:putative PIN family toxin of toxin-antitoxin system
VSGRVVFDTTTVVSALLFENGRLRWLRRHWQGGGCAPLVCRETAAELVRVLAYPKFRLNDHDRDELLAEYLPYCETLELRERCSVVCRDPKDQMFLDLAQSGNAGLLVTGDQDILALAAEPLPFEMEAPEAYKRRVGIG